MKERIGSREEQGKSRKENWFTVEKNEGKDRRQGRAGEGEKRELVQRKRMRERIGSSGRGERRTNLDEKNEEKDRKQGQGKGKKGTCLEEKNEGKYMKQGRAGVGEKGVLV
jgi:hypothetical protein